VSWSTPQYVPRHNPFVYFDDVTCNTNPGCAYCIAHDVPSAPWPRSPRVATRWRATTGSRPTCAMICTNTCSPPQQLDSARQTWLSNNIPHSQLSAYSNTARSSSHDEGRAPATAPLGMIVIRRCQSGGYSNTIHYTHSSTLLTMQEIFNVGLFSATPRTRRTLDLFMFGAQSP